MSKYTLEKKPESERNKFIVTIKADSNDANYITKVEKYSKKDFDEYVIDALIDLKQNYSGSHELENYPNEHDLPIPFNGWDGYCHTLETLYVQYVDEEGVVLDVRF